MYFIKKALKSLGTIKSIPNVEQLYNLLNDPIILVDVGSTGGIESHFEEIDKFLHVITFDPDPRAITPKTKGKFENYKIALWSKKEMQTLCLTQYPQASSLYQLNEKILSSFLNFPCHKKIGIENIEVNAMQNILPQSSHPDFIKIDAEGADLEILKGAEKYLKTSCLGIQTETSFANRHSNAPYFSDIDQYLRKFGYILMQIEPERWIRKNNIYSAISNPQIIWGNAIYILSIETFLKRISDLPEKNRETTITKFITILLIHKFHDYAYELCTEALKNNIISNEFYSKKTLRLILQSIPSTIKCYLKSILSILISCVVILLCSFFPKKRKKALNYFKARIRYFARLLINIRFGPYNTCT